MASIDPSSGQKAPVQSAADVAEAATKSATVKKTATEGKHSATTEKTQTPFVPTAAEIAEAAEISSYVPADFLPTFEANAIPVEPKHTHVSRSQYNAGARKLE